MYLMIYSALVAGCGVAAGCLIMMACEAYERRRSLLQKAADAIYEGDVRAMRRYVSRERIKAVVEGIRARDRP